MTEPEGTAIPNTTDDLRGRTPDELREMVEVLDAHLRALHQEDNGELRHLDPDEQKAFKTGLEIREKAMEMLDEHRRISDIFRRRPESVKRVYANLREGLSPGQDVTRLSTSEARDHALRTLDDRSASSHLRPEEKDEVERQVRKNTDIARRVLVTENEHYRNAWLKLVTRPNGVMYLDDEERNAMRAFDEYRVMSEGTTTAGGFGIPVKLAA